VRYPDQVVHSIFFYDIICLNVKMQYTHHWCRAGNSNMALPLQEVVALYCSNKQQLNVGLNKA
jgi:hypothetical protein